MATDRGTIALNRFGLGPRPGDVRRIAADPRGAVLAELAPRVALIDNAALPTTEATLASYREMRAAKQAAETAGTTADASQMANAGIVTPARYYRSELAVRLRAAARADIGYVERLVSFWTNHFAVEAGAKAQIRGMVGALEREAIRPHVLGRFSDMLLAVTRHAAMLAYLDNAESVGPNSRAGVRRDRGLNENHARELMELHTIGVDGGYTQADVTALAKVLTGWSSSRGEADNAPIGQFEFRPAAHEPGPQTIMGTVYDQPGERQGLAVLANLARHPATAEHIAAKLARAFVADDPPAALVSDLAATFRASGGDLAALARRLVESEGAWQGPGKFKTPQQFVLSSARALGIALTPSFALQVLRALGQTPWDPPSPAGFDDTSATWLAPDAMTTRLDAAEQMATLADPGIDPPALLADITGSGASPRTVEAVARAESRVQGLALLLMSPEFQRS